jgi:hypothetical protein
VIIRTALAKPLLLAYSLSASNVHRLEEMMLSCRAIDLSALAIGARGGHGEIV